MSSAFIRSRLLDVPLERDEGEYAYAGQLMLQGVPPYEQVYNMKLPGVYAAYAVIIAVFGQTHTAIHVGLLVVNSATILLLFVLARRLMDDRAALIAAAGFAVLSVGPAVQGMFANAEHFVMLFVVGGLLGLLEATKRGRSWWFLGSGMALGIGFVMKQHGAAFIIFGALYLAAVLLSRRPIRWRPALGALAVFSLGAVSVYGGVCLILAAAGVFDSFWFWTVEYAAKYVSQVSFREAVPMLVARASPIAASAPLLWLAAGIGLIGAAIGHRSTVAKIFLIGFAGFSLLAISPGFFFRPHYFVLLLPAAALLIGVASEALFRGAARWSSPRLRWAVPVGVAAVVLGQPLVSDAEFLFRMSPDEASRAVYGFNPFPESLEIGQYIREHTSPHDRIAVIGSEPQIYFYSGRRSASGHIYVYALMETHEFALELQQQMINEIEAAKPAYIVYVNIPSSWLIQPGSHPRFLEWFNTYLPSRYQPMSVIEILPDRTESHFAPQLQWPPNSPLWIGVLERKQRGTDLAPIDHRSHG